MPQVAQQFPSVQAPLVDAKTGIVSQVWLHLFQALWQRTGSAQGTSSTPSGVIAEFAGDVAPAGWSVCDGGELSRTEQSALYAAIGTKWGSGNGSTTFNKPNFLNKFRRGSDTVAVSGGADTVKLTELTLAPHTHDFSGASHTHAVNDPGHLHTVTDPGHVHTDGDSATTTTDSSGDVITAGDVDGTTGSSVTGISIDLAVTGITIGDAVVTGTIGETGEGEEFSIIPAYVTTLPIIKL